MPVWGNLKLWVSAVGCLFLSWTQSRNSIQVHNYVFLDTSSLMHDITLKDQVMYAWGVTSLGQSCKRAHMLGSGLVGQLVIGFEGKHASELSWHLQCEAASRSHNWRIYLCLSFSCYWELPHSWCHTYRLILSLSIVLSADTRQCQVDATPSQTIVLIPGFQ